MKKILFSLVTLFLMGLSAHAQVCRINNSNDNVEVYSCELISNSTVSVTVGNDSQDISANVTITVEVTYKGANYSDKKVTYSGKGLAQPNRTTEIKISIQEVEHRHPVSAKVVSISGTKCL